MKLHACLLSLSAAALLALGLPGPAFAESAPYESYNYDSWSDAVPAPAAYLPEKSVSGSDLGVGDFVEPSDIAVSARGLLYIVDSGNARIVVVDGDWRVKSVIDRFERDGQPDGFDNPTGLYVDEAEQLYVADSGHSRIVVLGADGAFIRTIEKPSSDILPDGFAFTPLKVAVDKAGRVYVVAKGIFEGIMQFDGSGAFIGYVGTNKVSPDYAEYFWRMLSTKAQKAQMVLFVPTEFSNLDMDGKGFLFATNIDPGSREPIKRLNPSGDDVLKRFGYFDVAGDVRYRSAVGPSRMIDVNVRESGLYSVLDSSQGKVFTYDHEGNLLYIYGGKGSQRGTVKTPAAIEQLGDRQLVLDRGRASIEVYAPTRYGSAVNKAAGLHYTGDELQAVPAWKEVLKLNANFDLAYIGIGKSLLMERKNKEAMTYFKLGMDRDSYSVAFKRYRREVMKEHFGTALTILLAAVAAYALWRLAGRRLLRGGRSAGPPPPWTSSKAKEG
ncbi:NHL repeat-containing protein [Paenibacillus sp. B01]|uniref:NHL repeat-containing protein n=1 Tax=Paenibacillus sp. B01 TaxID=2660554 RepID=UPI00129A0C7F|nr:NHL repeat-containing protein [Paenibacillus sp. B01]QGG55243.1 gluconolactonase [Paenibacillus sp. B01]